MKACSVSGCQNKYYAKGLCNKHYLQMRVHGKIRERTKRDPNDYIIEDGFCKIGCYDNKSNFVGYTLIDIEDMEKCKQYQWHFDTHGYVWSNSGIPIKLHNLILGIEPTKETMGDHINRNTADNRKENLRICTKAQNHLNRPKPRNNTSGYKGVTKSGNKWRAQIGFNGKHIDLGFFGDVVDAARAYNSAAMELHGEFACINVL